MKLKKFDDFNESLSEKEWYEGNTSFSRWLRSMDDRLGYAYTLPRYERGSKADLGTRTLGSLSLIVPTFTRLILKAGAAVSDVLFKGKDKERYSRMSNKDLSANKKQAIEDWEEENIKGKRVTQQDAEEFYKSGILKGKKHFGDNYDPKNPKNDEEKGYTEYFTSAMKKYYSALK
jgi:hypothetical protein